MFQKETDTCLISLDGSSVDSPRTRLTESLSENCVSNNKPSATRHTVWTSWATATTDTRVGDDDTDDDYLFGPGCDVGGDSSFFCGSRSSTAMSPPPLITDVSRGPNVVSISTRERSKFLGWTNNWLLSSCSPETGNSGRHEVREILYINREELAPSISPPIPITHRRSPSPKLKPMSPRASEISKFPKSRLHDQLWSMQGRSAPNR
eukprot:Gregarina_sp_Poly_1__8911@NODE_538_length_7624_cov_89_908694_g425_i0_p4_GENE_NODE_538_length_7624_cov_89_908694_g425_i0NODE_538_length_7624_cov_89_908694_g425_i0_p4_ORF_typecomplete_len207_score14_34_NODE_538_length_7624_cov_89_908694_g425_i023002920